MLGLNIEKEVLDTLVHKVNKSLVPDEMYPRLLYKGRKEIGLAEILKPSPATGKVSDGRGLQMCLHSSRMAKWINKGIMGQ